MTLRTAQNYMQAARFLDGKPETSSHMRRAILYRLPGSDVATQRACKQVATARLFAGRTGSIA